MTAQGIVESALDKVKMIEDMDYDHLVISIKSSDVMMCVKAHEEIAKKTDYPLHVGITESGTLMSGNIKFRGRSGDYSVPGNRRHDPGISYRRSGGGNQVCQADFKDSGLKKRRSRGCFLPHLRPHTH